MILATRLQTVRADWASAIAGSLRENAPAILLIAVFVAAADLLSAGLGRSVSVFDDAIQSYAGYSVICAAALALAFIVWITHLSLVRKVSIASGQAWLLVFTEFFGYRRILLALPMLAIWPFLMNAFSQVKSLIPAAQPFYLDPALHALDRLLHVGQDPWSLLQPLLGYPIVTYGFNIAYALWLFVIYFTVLFQIVSLKNRRLRTQFLLSNVFAWTLLGGLCAILLSSAGPCYYGFVVDGANPYAPLMTYLQDTVQQTKFFGLQLNLISVEVQDLLWTSYQQADHGFARGISAAPSMHVASTWLFARLLHASASRGLRIFGWSFFALILVGSVHLGWHYAADGYISIAGAWIIWRSVGWWLDRPSVKQFLWSDRTDESQAALPQAA